MSYKITNYTKDRAKEIDVKVYPAINKKYKLDIYDMDGKKIASIGANGMGDYPTYKKLEELGQYPKGYAKERQRLYKIRHKNDNGTAGFYANKLLW